MNKIEELQKKISEKFPNSDTNLEDNKNSVHPDKCPWYLIVLLNGKSVAVEWQPDHPETLSFCNCGVFGCRGDISCHEIKDAIEIIRFCLKA